MDRPVLIYDAECAFCRRWVARWRAWTGDRIEYRPFQDPALVRRLHVPLADARRAVQLVTRHGRYEGADAVFRALERAPELATTARLGRLPVVQAIAEWLYRRIA